MRAKLLLALLAGVLVAGGAQGAALEIDVLEGYLAEHDRAPATPHCARHSGYVLSPAGPSRLPTGGTNALLEEHTAFHDHAGDGPGHRPSTDDADPYGETFLAWHEEFVAAYEAWRAANGHPPLEAWDPGTPIPPSLAYPFPERACMPGRVEDPKAGLPTWATPEGGDEEDPLFGHTRLCDFRDRNQFGKSISMTWHVDFHRKLGGEMRAQQGPRDPAFWAAHQFLIETTRALGACAEEANGEVVVPEEARDVPGPAAGLLLLGLAAAAGAARTRARSR